jgi:hypothetical protein
MTGWAWPARYRPDAIAAATAWVVLTDYPAFRWSRCAVMSDALAARTAAWSPESGWGTERVAPFLGDLSSLPKIVYRWDPSSARCKVLGWRLPESCAQTR